MYRFNILILFILLSILSGCLNKVEVTLKPRASKSITSVSVINNQIKVTGSNLANITTLKIKNGGLDETFTVESATATEVIANAGHAVTIGVGQLFDLILNSAEGAAIFPVSFSNTNGSITAVMLSSMGASTGQFLKFNGTTWIPSSITSSQTYKGTWNANTNTPDLNIVSPIAGDYYIVTTAGTQGAVTYAVGDYIISNATVWSKLTNSISFNGRTGSVVPTAGDYTWSQITKTGSKIQDIEDVDMTGVAAGKILKWSGTNWIMGTDNGGGTPTAGSVTNLEVAVGANIAQSKIQNLTSDLAGKEPTITAQATTKYFRGDKTFVTLDTSVVPENTNLYFTNARVLGLALTGFSANNAVITAADTVLSAFGKVQGQINNLGTGSANYLIKNSTDAITGVVNVGTIGLLQLNYVPVGLTDAVNKQYVDTAIGGGGSWSAGTGGNVGDVYRATGKVGIGTSTPGSLLDIQGGKVNIQGPNYAALEVSSDNTLVGPGGQLRLSGITNNNKRLDLGYDVTTDVGFIQASTNLGPYRNLLLNPLGANVGIGTISPITTLDVRGIVGSSSSNTWGSGANSMFKAIDPNGLLFSLGLDAGNTMLELNTQYWSMPIVFSVNNSEKMRITNAGFVGVNTATPQTKLDVNGAIRVGADVTACSGTIAGAMRFNTPNMEYCNGTSWGAFSTGGAVTTTEITDGTIVNADVNASAAIAQSKIANLTTDLATKEPVITAGTTSQYLRGDKSLSTFATDAINSVLSTYTISASTKPAIANTDSVIGAFNKIQKFVNDINTDYVSKSANQTINGTLAINSLTGFITVPTPVLAADAANKGYVDSYGQWIKGTAGNILDIYFNTGNVGIGTLTPTATLDVSGTIRATDIALVNGVKVGSDATICNASKEGTIRYNTTSKVMEFCNATSWGTIGGASSIDNTPNSFSFTSATNVNLLTNYTSNTVTLSSFDVALVASCSGCLISVNGGTYKAAYAVVPGDTLTARVTSSATTGVTTGTVTVGTFSTTYTATSWGTAGQWTYQGSAGTAGVWSNTPREECVAAGYTGTTNVSVYANSVNDKAIGSDRGGTCAYHTIDQRASGMEFWGSASYCPAFDPGDTNSFYCFIKNF